MVMKPSKSFAILPLLPPLLLALFPACSRRSTHDTGAVHLSLPARIKALDPIQQNDVYTGLQIAYAFEPLLEYHYLKRPYQLVPKLAASMPEVAKDKVTYTIRLKKGVRFQDDAAFPGGKGREVTAKDFVYSWKRLANPKNTATGWWVLDGKVAGLNEWREAAGKSGKADYDAEIPGLKAADDFTLVVKLKRPSAVFLHSLATLPTSVVPREAVEKYGDDFGQHPVGTGPYVLKENTPGSKLVWDRNPGYREAFYPSEGEPGDKEAGLLEDAGKRLPLNDRIVTHIHEESMPAWLSFLAGELDLSSIPKDSMGEALPAGGQLSPELAKKNVRLLVFPQIDLTRVSFNFADPFLAKNKLVRQALSLAFDTDSLIKTFYNGNAIPAQGPIPPGLAGYDPSFKNPWRETSLEKAKTLLAKAGFPGGKGLPALDFVTVAGASSRQMAEYIERQLAQLGVKLNVQAFSWPEYVMRVKNKQGQIWSFGWQAFYPDAENFLQLFYGKNGAPGPNDMNYVNPRFDALFEKAVALLDEKERIPLYREMQKIVADDVPCIFGVHRTDKLLAHPWLRNVKLHNFAYDQPKYYRLQR